MSKIGHNITSFEMMSVSSCSVAFVILVRELLFKEYANENSEVGTERDSGQGGVSSDGRMGSQ